MGQVSIFGGQQREVQVEVDPARLRAFGLTLQQVTQALGAENVDLPGGQVREPGQNLNLRVDAKFRSPGDIEGTVVSTLPSGGQVRVRDVATVVDGFKDQSLLSRVNGKDAVGITVTKQATANVTNTAAAVRAEVARIQPELPEGAELEIITRQLGLHPELPHRGAAHPDRGRPAHRPGAAGLPALLAQHR